MDSALRAQSPAACPWPPAPRRHHPPRPLHSCLTTASPLSQADECQEWGSRSPGLEVLVLRRWQVYPAGAWAPPYLLQFRCFERKTRVSPVIKGRCPGLWRCRARTRPCPRHRVASQGIRGEASLEINEAGGSPTPKLVLSTEALMELEEGSQQIKMETEAENDPCLLQDPVWTSCLQEAPVGTPGWADPASGCFLLYQQSGLAPLLS